MRDVTELPRMQIVDGIRVLEFNAEAFIIPNPVSDINSLLIFNDNYVEDYMKMLAVNGCDPDDPDNLMQVQLWFTSSDLHTENVCRHGARVADENIRDVLLAPTHMEFLPVSLFKGRKEGEVMYLRYPCRFTYGELNVDEDDLVIEPVELRIHLKLNQTEYRYRNFGNFENALERVIGAR